MNFLLNALGLLVVVIVCILVITFLSISLMFFRIRRFFSAFSVELKKQYEKAKEEGKL
jgi:membrane-anchored glycerophosphoryl diester phosphodiesterase (GDPDase)